MQAGQFSLTMAATVVLVFISLCGVSGSYSLNSHSGVAKYPPHSEPSRSQPINLASRLKLLNNRIAVIYDRYRCTLGALGHKNNRSFLVHRDASDTCPASFNSHHPSEPSSSNPSHHVSQPPRLITWDSPLEEQKQKQGKYDVTLEVECRTRLFDQPKVNETNSHVMTPLPEGFPGRELLDSDLDHKHLDIQELIDNLPTMIVQNQKSLEGTPEKLDKISISKALRITVKDVKVRHFHFLKGREISDVVGIQRFSNRIGIGKSMQAVLNKGHSILLIYCNENDPNTYYELIWERNDSKYSAEILMTYFTRVYHFVFYAAFPAGQNSTESEDIIKEAFKSASANICSRGSPGEAKVIFYTLQGLQTGPL
ncbi:hypothetical protein IWQ62_001223 [Dispira parvispora]|uniref:Effector protein n=1 Tax=Dispira parvispora TaxID=1520584 RepID=A0A9W8E446_9FUNG|nr:hypothetical protein IWQ62_001223 [Dispira parvispora]